MSTATIYQTIVKALKSPFTVIAQRWQRIPKEPRARIVFMFISFLLFCVFSMTAGIVLNSYFAVPVYIVLLSSIAFFSVVIALRFLYISLS